MRWAQALDVDEDLTDSDFSDSDDSDWDSDWVDDGDDAEERKEPQKIAIKKQTFEMHELTLPANKVLPFQFQSLFREAAGSPNMDIQQQIQRALNMAPTAA